MSYPIFTRDQVILFFMYTQPRQRVQANYRNHAQNRAYPIERLSFHYSCNVSKYLNQINFSTSDNSLLFIGYIDVILFYDVNYYCM